MANDNLARKQIYIPATKPETIQKLLDNLCLTPYQMGRVNNLRKLCELMPIAC